MSSLEPDPRVVQPTGKTVYIRTQSLGECYHKKDCDDIDDLERKKAVDKSVAEWKNLEPCTHCHNKTRGYTVPVVDGPDVDRIRIALAETDCKAPDLEPEYPCTGKTIRYHATDSMNRNYITNPTKPPVEWDREKQTYVWSE